MEHFHTMSAQEHSKQESSSYISYTVYLEKKWTNAIVDEQATPTHCKKSNFRKVLRTNVKSILNT